MKKILKISLALLFGLVSIQSFAQKKISNGLVKYQITDLSSEMPGVEMLKGTNINMYFMGEKQKTDMSMMGGMMRVQTILDSKDAANNVVLMDMMGQKIQLADAGEKAADMSTGMMKMNLGDFDISYNKKDKKKIAGYKCKKATIKPKDGPSVDLYVTKKIKPQSSQFQDLFGELDGFPLQFTVDTGMGLALTLTAQEVKGDVDSSNFSTPNGYKKMTMEEFQETIGGMMNLGF